uniref:Clavesin-2 n=1 Tax=Lygus hesperus TaxID=30085 RepID=A0A0A9WJV2_LYGHE
MAATRVMVVRPWASPHGEEIQDEEILSQTAISEEAARVAMRELREDEATRAHGLQQMREWIRKNKDVENVRTDNSFLLRFLRAKKFSLPMAQNQLLKYLNLRQTFSHMMMNLDYTIPPVLELINNGYLFPSPVRDKYGRRVILANAAALDPHKYDCIAQAKVHMLTYETLLEDEDNHIFGFNHIGDVKAGQAAHITMWSVTEIATIFKWGEPSVPMRHKEIHVVNLPTPYKYVYDFCSGRFSPKIRERAHIHTSLASLHSKVDPSVLPKEWGGVIPIADMIESWKQELASKRESLLALDKMKILDNSSILKRRNGGTEKSRKAIEDMCITGSFRKLEVD